MKPSSQVAPPEGEGAQNSRFLRACRGEAVSPTPVWLMRQAGRYMAAYRELRERYTTLQIAKTPELASEVTLQPIQAFDLDAAIIFSDILPPLEGMGLAIDIVKGEGPVIYNPARTPQQIAALKTPPPEEALSYTLQAIRLTRTQLDPLGVPLIGFAASPLTLAAYVVEGGKSDHYENLKWLMMHDPASWDALMSKLAQVVGAYLRAQAQAGAQALQMFEKTASEITPEAYRRHVQPYSRQALSLASEAGVPVIHFATNAGGLLTELHAAGGDVIGVDWMVSLPRARQQLGADVPLQGNLDPITLLTSPEVIAAKTGRILDDMAGQPHIFNVGRGLLRTTPVDHVKYLVDFVHNYTHHASSSSSLSSSSSSSSWPSHKGDQRA